MKRKAAVPLPPPSSKSSTKPSTSPKLLHAARTSPSASFLPTPRVAFKPKLKTKTKTKAKATIKPEPEAKSEAKPKSEIKPWRELFSFGNLAPVPTSVKETLAQVKSGDDAEEAEDAKDAAASDATRAQMTLARELVDTLSHDEVDEATNELFNLGGVEFDDDEDSAAATYLWRGDWVSALVVAHALVVNLTSFVRAALSLSETTEEHGRKAIWVASGLAALHGARDSVEDAVSQYLDNEYADTDSLLNSCLATAESSWDPVVLEWVRALCATRSADEAEDKAENNDEDEDEDEDDE